MAEHDDRDDRRNYISDQLELAQRVSMSSQQAQMAIHVAQSSRASSDPRHNRALMTVLRRCGLTLAESRCVRQDTAMRIALEVQAELRKD
ncbi:MAG: hypothetical protein ABIA47_04285 [bacterium]